MDSTGTAVVTVVLSIVALVVSVISLGASTLIGYLQWRAQAGLTRIEHARRAEEVSQKRRELHAAGSATVTAQWRTIDPALVVCNNGQSPAVNVTATVASGMPGHPAPAPRSADKQISVKLLGPGESFAIPMTTPYGMATAIAVDLYWQDSTGSRTQTVRLSTAN